jgi:hypothetical protein
MVWAIVKLFLRLFASRAQRGLQNAIFVAKRNFGAEGLLIVENQ